MKWVLIITGVSIVSLALAVAVDHMMGDDGECKAAGFSADQCAYLARH